MGKIKEKLIELEEQDIIKWSDTFSCYVIEKEGELVPFNYASYTLSVNRNYKGYDKPTLNIDSIEAITSKVNTNSITVNKNNWKVLLSDHTYISTRTAPNWFHRLMQRLVLGIKWESCD